MTDTQEDNMRKNSGRRSLSHFRGILDDILCDFAKIVYFFDMSRCRERRKEAIFL